MVRAFFPVYICFVVNCWIKVTLARITDIEKQWLYDQKTLYIRRLCTDRRQDVAVIFLFGLEALFTRDSRVHSSAVLFCAWTNGCYWLLQWSNQLLLAPIAIKPVSFLFSLPCGPWENTVMLKCRHPHSLAQSSYVMSLSMIPYTGSYISSKFVDMLKSVFGLETEDQVE